MLDMDPYPKGEFQSTPLIRGATGVLTTNQCLEIIFQSTPLIRGATQELHRGA